MRKPRVFLSATTQDLGTYRAAAAMFLQANDVETILQDNLKTERGSLVEVLRREIKKCDYVICLVGWHYGAEPSESQRAGKRRSYTQLEHDMAVEMGKQPFVLVAANDCAFDGPITEREELQELQAAYREQFREQGTFTHSFRNRAEMEAKLGKLCLKAPRPWLKMVGVAVALLLLLLVALPWQRSSGGAVQEEPVADLNLAAEEELPPPDLQQPTVEHEKAETSEELVGAQPLLNSIQMKLLPVPAQNPMFYAGEYEVTWKDWSAWPGSNAGANTAQTLSHPVAGVSVDQMAEFCKWLTAEDRKNRIISASQRYRLPTFGEWSRLAGLGTARSAEPVYPWGSQALSEVKLTATVGNFAGREKAGGNPFLPDDGYAGFSPVGSFPPNKLGLYDVSGNASELCVSPGQPYYACGGSWEDHDEQALDLRAARPVEYEDVSQQVAVGFRLVLVNE